MKIKLFWDVRFPKKCNFYLTIENEVILGNLAVYDMDKDLLKRPIKKRTRRWRDITKMGFKQIIYGGVEWIHLKWDIIQWRAVLNLPSASSAKVKNEWS